MPRIDDLKDKMTTDNQVVQDYFPPPSALWSNYPKMRDPFKLGKNC